MDLAPQARRYAKATKEYAAAATGLATALRDAAAGIEAERDRQGMLWFADEIERIAADQRDALLSSDALLRALGAADDEE